MIYHTHSYNIEKVDPRVIEKKELCMKMIQDDPEFTTLSWNKKLPGVKEYMKSFFRGYIYGALVSTLIDDAQKQRLVMFSEKDTMQYIYAAQDEVQQLVIEEMKK